MRVVVCFVLAFGSLPLLAQQSQLSETDFYRRLGAVAVVLTHDDVAYDPAYFRIPYPNGDIPAGNPLDYVLSFSGNPNKQGMLFTGTARAFYYSMDDGATWTEIGAGFPLVVVDLAVGQARAVVDDRVHELPADAPRSLRAVGR